MACLRTVKKVVGTTLSVVRDMLEYRSRKDLGRTSMGDDLQGGKRIESTEGECREVDIRVQSDLEFWYRSHSLYGGVHVARISKAE